MDKFDEYKLFTERVQHRSERRQNSSQIYLTVNTGIFGVVALLIKDSGLHGLNLILATIPLIVVGMLVCVIWARTILEFQKIIGWQYEQLREMENHIKGSFRMHNKEWQKFYNPTTRKKNFSFSGLETWMPIFFISLYIIYSIGMIIVVSLNLI